MQRVAVDQAVGRRSGLASPPILYGCPATTSLPTLATQVLRDNYFRPTVGDLRDQLLLDIVSAVASLRSRGSIFAARSICVTFLK